MPEGDTVHQTADALRDALAGRRLTRSDVRVPRFATTDLSGRTVEAVVARGKHLLIRIEEGITLHSHLKMEGSWRVYPRGGRWNAPAHQARVVLETETSIAVGFLLSMVEIVPCAREDDLVGHLGPDPLGDDWDAAEAVRRLVARASSLIAEALIDQRAIAGFGNVYKSEMLFLRGIRPSTPVSDVADLRALVDLGARLMRANRHRRARVTTGEDRPGRRLWVYGRAAEPCRCCGTTIARDTHGPRGEERVTFWCPACQPVTGARSAP